jgi:hypothetical protein
MIGRDVLALSFLSRFVPNYPFCKKKPEAYEIGPGSFLRPFFGSSGYNRT